MAGRSTDGAFEPIGVRNAAPEGIGAGASATARVISFNFGMRQGMLDSAQWHKTHKWKFQELLWIFGGDWGADLVFGCEVGGHKKWPG